MVDRPVCGRLHNGAVEYGNYAKRRSLPMISNLLLAVDIDTSSNVTQVTGDLAESCGASVAVLHCDELDGNFDSAIWLDDDKEPKSAVGKAVSQLHKRGINARAVTGRSARRAGTADVVLDEAAHFKADIVVLGLPALHHLGGVFVGSVGAELAARTTIPLLLVPDRA
jgi:nucleotide-binding universal stress UspA family protein